MLLLLVLVKWFFVLIFDMFFFLLYEFCLSIFDLFMYEVLVELVLVFFSFLKFDGNFEF